MKKLTSTLVIFSFIYLFAISCKKDAVSEIDPMESVAGTWNAVSYQDENVFVTYHEINLESNLQLMFASDNKYSWRRISRIGLPLDCTGTYNYDDLQMTLKLSGVDTYDTYEFPCIKIYKMIELNSSSMVIRLDTNNGGFETYSFQRK